MDNSTVAVAVTADFNTTWSSDEAGLEAARRAVEVLGRYYVPCVVVVGLLGNTLSLVVFLLTYLNRLSLSVYLAALAVSDNGFLLALGLMWLEYVDWPLFHSNGWCQLIVYLGYVSSFLSVWFVVSFTVERYIAICHSLRRPEMCTTWRAKCVVSSLSVLGVFTYSISLWTSGVAQTKDGRYNVCVAMKRFYNIHKTVIYVDTLVTLLVPFTAILTLNVAIAYNIAYFYSKHNIAAAAAAAAATDKSRPRSVERGAGQGQLGWRAQVKVSRMLLVVSSVFLVVNAPSYVIRMRLFVQSFTRSSHQTSLYHSLLQQLSQYLFYLGFAINFPLYNLCCKKFRAALRRMLWQMRYKISNIRSSCVEAIGRETEVEICSTPAEICPLHVTSPADVNRRQ